MSYFDDELIPGLASFMEGDEEAASAEDEEKEAKEEAEEAKEEVDESSDKAEVEDEQVSMYCTMFDECARMYNHVKTYGVDRSFLSLCNYDNRLGRCFNITLPACEAMAAEGTPYSQESIACLEGLGETLKKAWNFVVKVVKSIGRWISDRIAAIKKWVVTQVRRFQTWRKDPGALKANAGMDKAKNSDFLKSGQKLNDKGKVEKDYDSAIADAMYIAGVFEKAEGQVLTAEKLGESLVSRISTFATDTRGLTTGTNTDVQQKIAVAAKAVNEIRAAMGSVKKVDPKKVATPQMLNRYMDLGERCAQLAQKVTASPTTQKVRDACMNMKATNPSSVTTDQELVKALAAEASFLAKLASAWRNMVNRLSGAAVMMSNLAAAAIPKVRKALAGAQAAKAAA